MSAFRRSTTEVARSFARALIATTACVHVCACSAKPVDVLWASPPSEDAAVTDDASAPVLTAPLQVRLHAKPTTLTCGACTDLSAEVTGGVPPYTYQWSDLSWTGPGPHPACPEATTAYVVLVFDSSTTSQLGSVPHYASDSQVLICSAPDTGPITQTGCSAPLILEIPMLCRATDLSIPTQISTPLSQPMHAGQSYEVNFEINDIVRGLLQGLVADVYGAMQPCEPLDLLGTITFDATTTQQRLCASARQEYASFVIAARPGSNSVGLSALSAATICTGCSGEH